MYALISKQNMSVQFKGALLPEGPFEPYFVLQKKETTWELSSFSLLELKMLYRSIGIVIGTALNERESIERSVNALLNAKPEKNLNQADLYQPESDPEPEDEPAEMPSAPRSQSRVTIFETADRIWKEAGSPVDLPRILALRKVMMAVLETEHGIKKTTSSTALGNWQKVRLENILHSTS